MVGPGDVDEDLEPEVKDECNSKYGEVVKVLIHEAFGTAPDEAVKIFLEFKRIESAIKGISMSILIKKIDSNSLLSDRSRRRLKWTFLWRTSSSC